MSTEHQRVRIYFVPRSKIKPALVDMQGSNGCGFSWVRSCDYLKHDDKFAVQVVLSMGYPYLENRWKEWEE